MTWLGYDVVLDDGQRVGAVVIALIFMVFGRVCGRPLWMCLTAGLLIYVLALCYAVNENAMEQLKSDFCERHPETSICVRRSRS